MFVALHVWDTSGTFVALHVALQVWDTSGSHYRLPLSSGWRVACHARFHTPAGFTGAAYRRQALSRRPGSQALTPPLWPT
jgi:hypothetical protein